MIKLKDLLKEQIDEKRLLQAVDDLYYLTVSGDVPAWLEVKAKRYHETITKGIKQILYHKHLNK